MAERKPEPKVDTRAQGPKLHAAGRDSNVRYLVRICNTDLDGNKPVYFALTKIKGIGRMYSNAICHLSKVDQFMKIGLMPENEVAKIEDVIKNPKKYGIPTWMMNRRKDPTTGEDNHFVTTEIEFNKLNDIKFLQKIKCYKGVRHYMKLPVRGQKTRSNFRKNKGNSVGVIRKSVATAAPAKDDKKK